MAIDQDKLNALLGKFVNELGAAIQGPSILTGEQLGFYKALNEHGPLTAAELSERTGVPERYVREWLTGQAASGLVEATPPKADTR